MRETPTDVRRQHPARLMLHIQRALDSVEEFDVQLETVLELLADELGADAAALCVGLSANDGRQLEVAFARRGHTLRRTLLAKLGLREKVLETGRSLRLDDARAQPGFRASLEEPFGPLPRSLLAVPLRLRQKSIGLLVAARGRLESFTDEDEELLAAVADKLTIAAENDRLLRQLRLDLEERELLLEISRRVGRTLDLETVLEHVFEAMHPVVPFHAGAIFLAQPDGSLALSAQCGYADETPLLEVPEGKGLIGLALRRGRAVRVDDVREEPDYFDVRESTRSEIAVPIRGGGQTVGVINLESDEPNAYSERDQRIAELIAAQVSSAIINAQLHRDRFEHTRLDHELELAREIQLGLFPKAPPDHHAIEIDAINLPSSAVGGDYYDYLLCEPDRLWLALADVSGHGLSAALLTGVTQTGFRLLAQAHRDPAELAELLNGVLHESTPPNQFVAAVLAILDLQTGELRYCNAGHLPANVYHDGRWIELSGGGVPLGLFDGATYESHTVQLEPGALLLFYTDGIPEAEDDEGLEFGIRRLLDLVADQPDRAIDAFAPAMRAELRRHRGRHGSHADDVTLMTARWHGPDGPASS